jgi:hypothetical protein
MFAQTPDLMSFLYDVYKEDVRVENEKNPETEARVPTLEGFIEFSRKYLAEVNRPMNVTYLPVGLGLRLQYGQTVGFVRQELEDQGMRDSGIPISRPQTIPGMHGINDTSGLSI